MDGQDQVEDAGSKYIYVGWLSRQREYPVGPVDQAVIDTLIRIRSRPQRTTFGVHICGFCSFSLRGLFWWLTGNYPPECRGSSELHVPGENGRIYVVPSLIVHYIEKHGYRPPDEFIAAVRKMSTEGDPEYVGR